jgi:hypothetical protein
MTCTERHFTHPAIHTDPLQTCNWGNIPWVMTRYVGYIMFVCTQRARVRMHAKRVHTSAFTYVWIYYLQTPHTTNHHKLHGLCTIHVQAPHARVRTRVFKLAHS